MNCAKPALREFLKNFDSIEKNLAVLNYLFTSIYVFLFNLFATPFNVLLLNDVNVTKWYPCLG